MDFSEKWGTDVEEAVKLALNDLKVSRDEVEVIVLEEPSKGFLGIIGAKLAKVRVEKKKTIVEPKIIEKKRPEKKKNQKTESKTDRRENKQKSISIREASENLKPVENHVAIDFLKSMTEKMGLNLDIKAKEGKEALYLNIHGKDSGTVIGKRGQTLDAIQYLTSLVVNKEQEKYRRVVVDAENYRSKREKTLQQLANRLADKVIKTRKSVRLEPMNPYERKVIHATLQSNSKVTTKSEGEEPYRRVIIELK